MRLTTEITQDDHATLIIGNPHMRLIHDLALSLKSKDVSVLVTSHIPPEIPKNVNRVFCFSDIKDLVDDLKKLDGIGNIVFLSSTSGELSKKTKETIHFLLKHNSHIKIALIPKGEHDIDSIIKKIFTLTFNPNHQYGLISAESKPVYDDSAKESVTKNINRKKSRESIIMWALHHPVKTILWVLFLVVFVHISFVFPLLFSGASFAYAFYSRSNQFEALPSSSQALIVGKKSYLLSEEIYQNVKRGWLFVGAAPNIDRIYDTGNAVFDLQESAKNIQDDAGIMLSRMFETDSIDSEQIDSRKESIKKNLDNVRTDLNTLEANLPKAIFDKYDLETKFAKSKEYLSIADVVLARFDELFGKNAPKLYVVFFGNNNELRPGGGFIGSFALVKVENLKIREWKVYDVYDADGQLKARVRPPDPISTYLHQPFYFLRDSAFTPDFPTNALVAEDFLKKELNIPSIDGAFMVTFASIESILRYVGPIYVPEYKTTITYENAYYKTQTFAEDNFFPGSTKKRDFLDALLSELIIKFTEPIEAAKILLSVRESFDNKQIAGYFKDDALQSVFEEFHWSGRQISPSCLSVSLKSGNKNVAFCKALYVYPVEANLGVNKANANVKRSYKLNTRITQNGEIEGEFITDFTNDSIKDVFPGGPYKNYYQIYFPKDTKIISVIKDNSFISKYDLENTNYTKVGYFMNLPETSSSTFKIRFKLSDKFDNNSGMLQVIIQKQIGIPFSPITMTFGLPKSYEISDSNFSPLALQDVFEYNSVIDSDKIYYLNFR
ncbi:MAG: DUF4012 domain-containing protein [Patescibacteria group bacterium]